MAKIDPPNYDFKIDEFKTFYPGSKLTDIEKKYGKGKIVKKNPDSQIKRYFFKHQRYTFPINVQFVNDKVIDFTATLPSYFLHNVFHQSLINRLGPQNKYLQNAGQAVYIWNKDPKLTHIYEGGCSITCHPISYSIKSSLNKKFPAIYDQLRIK